MESEILRLRGELRQLAAAEGLRLVDAADAVKRRSAKGTIKEQVVAVLDGARQGLDTDGIQAKLLEHFGRDVAKSSLTPQLSRLKSEGVIEQEERIWRMPVRLRPIEQLRRNVLAREIAG